MRSSARTTVVAIVSGKGGTGRSVVSVNLACVLAAAGHSVALIDADVGNGACALLLGESNHGVHLVAPPSHADIDPATALAALDVALGRLTGSRDFVVIDAASGRGDSVRWALDRADAGLLVLVDEPTAVADAYALVKQTWQHDADYPMAAIVNLVDDEEEAADVAARFSAVTSSFLGQEILYGGWVPFSAVIRRSVRDQQPAVHQSPLVRHAFEQVSERVRYGSWTPAVAISLN